MPRYRIDLHGHCQGDPVDAIAHTIHEHIDHARACGLDAIALTWHGRLFDNAEAVAYARERGLLLIPGMESNLEGRYHVLVLNVQPGEIGESCTLDDLRRLRQNPERFILAPHPYYPHCTCLGSLIDAHPDCFDAVEWCHYDFAWIPSAIRPNARARRWAQRHGKPIIACSDAHDLHGLGRFNSEVEAEALTAPAIFAALRAGHVQFTPEPMTLRYLTAKSWEIARSFGCCGKGISNIIVL